MKIFNHEQLVLLEELVLNWLSTKSQNLEQQKQISNV